MNRVAKKVVGEKMIVRGRSARWWDSEFKDRIALRRENVVSGIGKCFLNASNLLFILVTETPASFWYIPFLAF